MLVSATIAQTLERTTWANASTAARPGIARVVTILFMIIAEAHAAAAEAVGMHLDLVGVGVDAGDGAEGEEVVDRGARGRLGDGFGEVVGVRVFGGLDVELD